MKILKLKSIIYKYTGWYLADSEELEYITSKEFWKEWRQIASAEDNDMSPRDIQGLLIGSWQAKHGFARRWNMWKREYSRNPLWKVTYWFGNFGIQAKDDLESIFRRFYRH